MGKAWWDSWRPAAVTVDTHRSPCDFTRRLGSFPLSQSGRDVSSATEHLKGGGPPESYTSGTVHSLFLSQAVLPSSLRDGGARTVECKLLPPLQRSPVTTSDMALGERNRLPHCVAAFLRPTVRGGSKGEGSQGIGGISEIALPESRIS